MYGFHFWHRQRMTAAADRKQSLLNLFRLVDLKSSRQKLCAEVIGRTTTATDMCIDSELYLHDAG